MGVRIGVKVFTLPGEEGLLNNFINKEEIEITNKVITALPKEGIILYLVEYEELIC